MVRWLRTSMMTIIGRLKVAALIALIVAWGGTSLALAPTGLYVKEQATAPPYHHLAAADRVLVERVVTAEARGEPYQGMVAVAQVILDRLEHSRYPDHIEGVIGEFADPYEGHIPDTVKAAVAAVFDYGERVTEEVLLFFMNPITASARGRAWIINNCQQVLTIGRHVFYN